MVGKNEEKPVLPSNIDYFQMDIYSGFWKAKYEDIIETNRQLWEHDCYQAINKFDDNKFLELKLPELPPDSKLKNGKKYKLKKSEKRK